MPIYLVRLSVEVEVSEVNRAAAEKKAWWERRMLLQTAKPQNILSVQVIREKEK